MNLVLTGFSQDVDLSNPDNVQYHLNLRTPDGQLIRLPVQKDTTEALILAVYNQKVPAPPSESEKMEEDEEVVPEARESDDVEMGKTFEMPKELTGDPDLDGPDLLDSPAPASQVLYEEPEEEDNEEENQTLDSEDDVPSL